MFQPTLVRADRYSASSNLRTKSGSLCCHSLVADGFRAWKSRKLHVSKQRQCPFVCRRFRHVPNQIPRPRGGVRAIRHDANERMNDEACEKHRVIRDDDTIRKATGTRQKDSKFSRQLVASTFPTFPSIRSFVFPHFPSSLLSLPTNPSIVERIWACHHVLFRLRFFSFVPSVPFLLLFLRHVHVHRALERRIHPFVLF